MAPPTPGLTTADIDQIRAGLAEGRKPKVVFTDSAGQIAGQFGQVVALTDPDDSDEWIVVHFGRDELPFSPSDLAIPVRASASKTATASKAVDKAASASKTDRTGKTATTAVAARTTPRRATTAKAPGPEPDPPAAPVPAQREGQRQERKAMPTTGAPTVEAAAAPGKDSTEQTLNGTSPNGANPNGANPNGVTSNGAGPAKVAKAAKPKPPASLVVTLQYAEKEWTVAAMQGSKSLAKPYVLKPSEALRMVALIDVPGVHEAVEAIIASERAEAEGRALRLREELAEIESRLADLNHG